MTISAELSKLEAKRLPLVPNYPPFKQWKRAAVKETLEAKPLCLYITFLFVPKDVPFAITKLLI